MAATNPFFHFSITVNKYEIDKNENTFSGRRKRKSLENRFDLLFG